MIPELGEPNTEPLRGVRWEHPRVKLALLELNDSAMKFARACSWDEPKASNRLQNAAIAFAATVREYTVKE